MTVLIPIPEMSEGRLLFQGSHTVKGVKLDLPLTALTLKLLGGAHGFCAE